jgi:23S rRNA (guanosine2251-2'-O)-methyltransferase
MKHPRDRFITVYGRKPVIEALRDPNVGIEKLLVAHTARGGAMTELLAAAKAAGVKPKRVNSREITRLSRNERQDQGVVADVVAKRMGALSDWIAAGPAARSQLLLLDRLTNPANIGMIVRAATGAGLDGIVVPRVGSPEIGPLVIKASAGVAFRAPILRCTASGPAASELVDAGFTLIGLRGHDAEDLYLADWPERACFVLGNETDGLGEAVSQHITRWARIPMANDVESLNVATAAAVVAFEIARRTRAQSASTATESPTEITPG